MGFELKYRRIGKCCDLKGMIEKCWDLNGRKTRKKIGGDWLGFVRMGLCSLKNNLKVGIKNGRNVESLGFK